MDMIKATNLYLFVLLFLIGCIEETNINITMEVKNLDYFLCVPTAKRIIERGDTSIYINQTQISNVADSKNACKKNFKNTIKYIRAGSM